MKNCINEVMGVCQYEIRRMLINRRWLMVFALLYIVIHMYGDSVREFCVSHNETASAFPMFVGLVGTHGSQSLLYMIWVYLICDAPFVDCSHRYVLIRCGRLSYILGIILFLIIASIMYWILVLLFGALVMWGSVSFSLEWGRIFYTLARSTVPQGDLIFLSTVQRQFNALEAFLISMYLQVFCSVFIALLVALGNYFNGWIGITLGLSVIMFDKMFFWFGLPYYYMHFSPVTLANLNVLDLQGASYHPNIWYAIMVLPSLTVAVEVLCVLVFNIRDNVESLHNVE